MDIAASIPVDLHRDRPPILEDVAWISLVLAIYASVTVFLAPNYEQLPFGLRLHGVCFNTAVGALNGFVLFDCLAARRRGLFLVASAAVILGAALFHEMVMEALVFHIDAINAEGLYYSLLDAFWMSVVFLVLRVAGFGRRRPTGGQAVEPAADADHLLIKVSDGTRKVRAADILYIKAERDFSRLVCADREFFVSETIKALQDKAARFGVVRIHRSFAVNLNRVDRLSRAEAGLGVHRVPVGRKHAQECIVAWRAIGGAIANPTGRTRRDRPPV